MSGVRDFFAQPGPLTIAMCYERAVDVARTAAELPLSERLRLLSYLMAYSPEAANMLLDRLVAAQPELVATAMLDMHLDRDASIAGYAYGDGGEPVALEGHAEIPAELGEAMEVLFSLAEPEPEPELVPQGDVR